MGKNFLLTLGVIAIIGASLLLYKSSSTDNVKPQDSTTKPTLGNTRMMMTLFPQLGPTQTGFAEFINDGKGNMTVKVSVKDYPENTPQPAHIHVGACPKPGAVKYPLTSLVDGVSETVIKGVTVESMMNELPLALNVHMSEKEPKVYVSCGDIKMKKK